MGLYISHDNAELSEAFLVDGNDLSGNGTAIELHNYANVVVTGNDLSGSSQYGIANYTSNEIDARNNYWGESETDEMALGGNPKGLGFIYDGRDEGSYGAVNYAGWLLEAGGEPSGVTVAGQLNFIDASGAVTTTYQGGDSVVLQVVDGDRNGDSSTADSITVLLTSTTEDTGTPASASEPVAGDNTGDGTLSVVANGFETKTEDWTVTATYADEMTATFQVEGSVSGTQRDLTLDMMMGETSVEYTTDGGEVALTLTQGSTRFFSVLDGFTFSTTAADIEGETITLDETGADTGVFTKTVVLNETDVSVLGNGELEAIPGDRITAFYEDPQGDYGDLEFAREVALYTRTVVPGGVIGTTIWDVEGSPYLVTGDLTVSSGASLIIEAGVEVLFLANSDDQSGGQRLSDAELIVKGALVVEGTEAAPVVLGSSEANARAGDWGGIRVENGSLSLTYAHLSHSGYGISAQNLSGAGLVIDRSTITESGRGIYLESANGRAIVLTNNVIDVSTGYEQSAVELYQGWNESAPATEFVGNTVANANGQGVFFYAHRSGLNASSNVIRSSDTAISVYYPGGDTFLVANDILNLRDYQSGNGIFIPSTENGPVTNVLIESNRIEGYGTGIYFRSNGSPIGVDIAGNELLSNSTGLAVRNLQGLSIRQGLSITSNVITGNYQGLQLQNSVPSSLVDNVIAGNSQVGLYISHDNAELSEAFLVDGNDLSGNGTAIELHNYANVVVTGNDLSGSSQYGIANYTSNEIDARNNYWGESETDEMALGGNPKGLGFIYDGRDEGSYGAVNYAGWLLEAGGEPSGVTVAGQLNFIDASGAVTTTYQGGDSVVLQVVDGDRNGDSSTADSITVLLTSTTEDTGTPASASEPVAGDNTGDGTLSVVANGFETKTEDWTVTATYADEMTATFQVEGSVSGTQRDLTLDMMMGETSVEYTTDGGEVALTLTQGSTRFFSVLDGFTFSTTAADIEGETITLDETGADTGVFTKTVVLNETDVSVLGNGELEAIPGDRITAFYEDPQGDYGDLEFAREVALYTRTVVPGGVIGTTIWDVEGSPYLVTGDLTVSSGASLIIEAGVEVLFLANSDDQSGGQRLSDAELIVKGALVVEGTEAAPVVLGSSEANARAGDWGGIRVENGSLSLTYAHLSHSGYGISAQNLSGAGLVIDRSTITESGRGIYLESANGRAIVLTNNVIDVSTGYEQSAVELYQGWNESAPATEFVGNTVANANGQGVFFYAASIRIECIIECYSK